MSAYNVDAEQVHAATQSTHHTITRIQTDVQTLLAQLTGLQSSWSGQASIAFQSAVTDWRATQLQVEQSLAGLNRALSTAGTQYAETEASNARQFLR